MESGILAGYPVVDIRIELDRRLVPRRRLERDGVQGRGLDGLQGGDEARQADAARADDGRRGRDARGLPRRRHGQPQLPPRPGRAPRARRQRPADQGDGSAGRDVRLRDRRPLDDAGPGDVHDAVRPLRGSAAVDRRRAGRRAAAKRRRGEHGQAEVRAHEAAPQRRHDRSHRPRQDDPDGGDHEGARGGRAATRP